MADSGEAVWIAIPDAATAPALGLVRVVALRDQRGDLWQAAVDRAWPGLVDGLVTGLAIAPPELRWRLLMVLVAVMLPYLFYLPFDHWETLRFLLPGLAILSVMIAASLHEAVAQSRESCRRCCRRLLIFSSAACEMLLRESSAVGDRSRSRSAIRWQVTGSTSTPRPIAWCWQTSTADRCAGTASARRCDGISWTRISSRPWSASCKSHGAEVYVALEGDEVAMFDQRFKAVIDQLQVDHVGRVRNISSDVYADSTNRKVRRYIDSIHLPPNR